MNPKNQPKPNRRAAFLNAWKQAFRLDLLSQKGIEKLLELKEQYSLSYDDVQDLTGMPKSSLQRQKNKTPDQKTKPGPKFKLSLDKKDLIFKNLSDMRSENKIVQILDLQKQADIVVGFSNETSKKDKHFISPSTASRLFKEHKWTYRRTQNRLLASEPKERDAFIKNFLKKVQLFITALKIKPDNFYVMDESGIHTNLARKYTFTPINDKNVYVRVPNDSTKDTIIVTLSASGGGHLYYVPFFPQTSEHRAIKGVGKDQILDWGRAFIGRTQKQNGLLLLDNLNSHKDENLLEYLRLNNIFVLPFPVRCADKLSVLDNSFLRSYKANLSLLFSELAELKGDDLKNRKREIIFQEFEDEVKNDGVTTFFSNIGYLEMFSESESFIKEGFVPNSINDITQNTYEVDTSKRNEEEYTKYDADDIPIYPKPDIPIIKCRNPNSHRSLISLLYSIFIIEKFRVIWNQNEHEEDPIGLIKLLRNMDNTESETISIDAFIKAQYGTSYLIHSGDLIDITAFLFNSMNISFNIMDIEIEKGIPHLKEIKTISYLTVPQEETLYDSLKSFFYQCNEVSKSFYRFYSEPEILMIFIKRQDNGCIEIPIELNLTEFSNNQTKQLIYHLSASFINNDDKSFVIAKNVHEEWFKCFTHCVNSYVQEASISYCGDTGEGFVNAVIYIKDNNIILHKPDLETIMHKETTEAVFTDKTLSSERMEMDKTLKGRNKCNYSAKAKQNVLLNKAIKPNITIIPKEKLIQKDFTYVMSMPDETCDVGIRNLGHTCYISVIFQLVFHIQELREAILFVNSTNSNDDLNSTLKGILDQYDVASRFNSNENKVKLSIDVTHFCAINNINVGDSDSSELFYDRIIQNLYKLTTGNHHDSFSDCFMHTRFFSTGEKDLSYFDTMIFDNNGTTLVDLLNKLLHEKNVKNNLPKYLTIAIGRPNDTNNAAVEIPFTLNMKNYIRNFDENSSYEYEIFAVIGRLFTENASTEHYVIFFIDTDHQWRVFNDSYTAKCDASDIETVMKGEQPRFEISKSSHYKNIVANMIVYKRKEEQ